MYNFDVEKATNGCINWIREWFLKNGKDCNAVLGISGGKDSSVVAALCVAALGKDRVIGVLMPQGVQSDIDYSIELCEFLGIRNYTVNVGAAVAAITDEIAATMEITDQSRFNLPARVRMATVYAVAQSQNGRVANTCNLSEDWVGYSTRYGDSVGDFAPLSNFTVAEVIAIGSYLGLPEKFVKKPPIDGLCGQTDEDKLGFTYETLDKYIREGIEPDAEIKKRIDRLHEINLFKLRYMDVYEYEG
ncbi:MAG: NAD(+) synthase [Clostridia bacterium]|nr:NAD(+) synthase [Clostridia bacterium]